jgi:hypothetical protein
VAIEPEIVAGDPAAAGAGILIGDGPSGPAAAEPDGPRIGRS